MLEIFYGAMKSGKTEELIRIYNNYKFEMSNKKRFVTKPALDTRDPVIKSRNGGEIPCDYLYSESDTKFPKEFYEADVIFIDEVQFTNEALLNEIKLTARTKDIYCSGLRSDFKANVFKPMAELLGIADHIREVRSLCKCSKNATMNQRFDENNNVVTTGDSIQIGHNYTGVCSSCFIY